MFTKAWSTIHDNQRFARPGMVFDSCRNVRAPNFFAARTGGALVNPPIARTACGVRVLKIVFAARYDFHRWRIYT